jgi:hypothetical protein
MSRPSTPIEKLPDGRQRLTVHRVCDRCGRDIGDATKEELEAAIVGPLPSVVDECGCLIATAAVAAIEGHRIAALIEGIEEAWWECECGVPLVGRGDAQDALDPHLVNVVIEAIATVRS